MVTKAGQDLLSRYGISVFKQEERLYNFEVWTEEDLEKLTQKRVKKRK